MVSVLPLIEVRVGVTTMLPSPSWNPLSWESLLAAMTAWRGAAACAELSGSGESGAVRGGLHVAALVTEVADVHGEAGGAEKSDHADGGEDEAVAGLAIDFFVAVVLTANAPRKFRGKRFGPTPVRGVRSDAFVGGKRSAGVWKRLAH